MKALKIPALVLGAAAAFLYVGPSVAQARHAAPAGVRQQGESSSSRPAEQDQAPSPDQDASQQAKKGKKQGAKGTSAPDSAPPPAPNGDDPISRRINNSAKAEHDVEVGRYYEKKEKYDAAIDRYKEAAELLPTFALPNRLMGEAYEKKHFLPEALRAYEKYLQVAPNANDAEEVRKRVARLRTEIQEDERKRAAAAKP